MLEDLGAGGIDGNSKDWIGSMIDMGFWPPRQGPRVKGFETAEPKLICVPFVGDLQTMTYRNDVYGSAPATWDEVIAKGKEGVAAGKIKYPVVFRGVSGNPIVTSWYPVFLSYGGGLLRRQVERHLQLGRGQGFGRLLRRHHEGEHRAWRGRVRLRQEGAAILAAMPAASSSTPAMR